MKDKKSDTDLEKIEYDIAGLDPNKKYLLRINVDNVPLSYLKNYLQCLNQVLKAHDASNIIVLPVTNNKDIKLELLKVIEDSKNEK